MASDECVVEVLVEIREYDKNIWTDALAVSTNSDALSTNVGAKFIEICIQLKKI